MLGLMFWINKKIPKTNQIINISWAADFEWENRYLGPAEF